MTNRALCVIISTKLYFGVKMEYTISMLPAPYPRLVGIQQYRRGWSRASCPKGNVCFLMLEGRFAFSVGDKLTIAEKNDLVFFKKETEYKVSSESDCKYFYIHFSGDMELLEEDSVLSENAVLIPEKTSLEERSEKRDRMVWLFGLCERIYREAPVYKKLRLENVFGEILLTAASVYAEKKSEQIPPSIKRIAKYISENTNLPLSLSEISDKYSLSKQYIMRSFKKYFGMSVTHYINRAKLERALILLRDTDMSVNEISDSLAYSQSSYFCRIFKDFFELTPSEYRHQIIE